MVVKRAMRSKSVNLYRLNELVPQKRHFSFTAPRRARELEQVKSRISQHELIEDITN